jgi:hypothetical protein
MLAPALSTELRPCLADLFRTCVHPPSLLLRVEHVTRTAQARSPGNTARPHQAQNPELEQEDVEDSRDPDSDEEQADIKRGRSHSRPSPLHRLHLSDGQLQVQAVLASRLHSRDELQRLEVGCIIQVDNFEVRSAPRSVGKGRVVYLAIQDCRHSVLHDKACTARSSDGKLDGTELSQEHGHEMSSSKRPDDSRQTSADQYRSWSRKRAQKRKLKEQAQSSSASGPHEDSDDSDAFDTITVAPFTIEQRRMALRRLAELPVVAEHEPLSYSTQPVASQSETQQIFALPGTPPKTNTGTKSDLEPKCETDAVASEPDASEPLDKAVAQRHHDIENAKSLAHGPQGSHSPALLPSSSLPSPSLSTLLALPPQKQHPCPPLLALISWTSPSLIYRPGYTPFPPKRHIKIHDQSISSRHSGLTVAVFVDAASFLPSVGTVALFRGLIMNWVRGGEDVILNRYPLKAGPEDDEAEWFVSDEARLAEMGYDLVGMKRWWAERNKQKQRGDGK